MKSILILFVITCNVCFAQSKTDTVYFYQNAAQSVEFKIQQYHEQKIMKESYRQISDTLDDFQNSLDRLEEKIKAKCKENNPE